MWISTNMRPQPESMKYHQKMHYWLAIHPAFLAASLIAVLLGTSMAIYQGYTLRSSVLVLALITVALMHAGMNVLVEYFDKKKGLHVGEHAFPLDDPDSIAMTDAMVLGEAKDWGIVLLWLSSISGAMLVALSGFWLIAIAGLGLLLGLAYAAPPLRLTDRGLGELVVATIFGAIVPLSAWFVQTVSLSWEPILIAVPMGLLVMNTLLISEYPERKQDRELGRGHWAVRLGAKKSAFAYLLISALSLLILMVVLLTGVLPALAWVSLLPFVLLLRAGKIMLRNSHRPSLLAPAIKLTIMVMITHGILLCVTLLLEAML